MKKGYYIKKKEMFLFSCLKRLKRVLRKLRFWETV